MTTPAQTTNAAFPLASWQRKLLPSGSSVTQWSSPGWERKLRPVSSSSPKRPDGSRPPKAWEHRWGYYRWLDGTRFTSDGPTGPVYEESGTWLDPNSGSLDYVLTQVARFSTMAAGVDYFPRNTYGKAVTNFLVKLQGNKASLGVTLAELRKTAGTISQACTSLVQATDAIIAANRRLKRKVIMEILHFGKVRKRRPGETVAAAERRMRSEKRVLDHWLMVQLGLKPGIQDIDALGQGLSHLINGSTPRAARLTIKSGSGEDIERQTFRCPPIWNVCWLDGACVVNSRCDISAVYEIPLSTGRTFEEWGLANPAPVLWELIPYSWVVDYLTNCGKWVQSLVPITGAKFLEGSVSYLQRVDILDQPTRTMRGSYIDRGGKPKLQLTAGRFTRVKLTSAIVPFFRPVIREKLNLTRLANALAALAKAAAR